MTPPKTEFSNLRNLRDDKWTWCKNLCKHDTKSGRPPGPLLTETWRSSAETFQQKMATVVAFHEPPVWFVLLSRNQSMDVPWLASDMPFLHNSCAIYNHSMDVPLS